MLKRTPLFEAHQRLGARLVEFGGWEMPVHYTSIMDEHHAVRTAAGIFDISHMGEVMVSGAEASNFLNAQLTNNIGKLDLGQGQYTLMCNERGGVIDDLYAYRISSFDFLLVVNASRIEEDVAWLQKRHDAFPERGRVDVRNLSDIFGAVAVQGPRVREFIDLAIPRPAGSEAIAARASSLRKNEFDLFGFADETIYVACTGYTGEDGFEVIAPAAVIEAIWNQIMEAGQPYGLKPCGLGARDTLRTEACYPLYGHELDENTTPIEAGVGFFVALDKGDFVGRSVLAEQKAKGVAKRAVAFKMTDKSAPPRPHYPIWSAAPDERHIGEVVSGTSSPTLNLGIGLGYVPPEFAKPGTPIQIEIRGRRSPAVVVQKPFYKKPV
ncbi:MAG: glycine cleavage system aminomethyltransferase GcvT [Pedosphaera sp.]|nr:glycine cleavage system aminomethyltransferase GcvT [Pedosphaera sp.]